eukprot:CAMPEP_0201515658 /NCGR_PEP_ID=MMETSP0161_2-20130828/7165_1 /ASSEMBLY_ACC=CAM_ASM_000251 /TAXON_ID=180227 /ORGANISM="Neoparamoeba aestuarina, Strain SoJaBio B1-5/56/2" /LENGTH=79 /DNA_ID=CAMNT_0047912547 /DNA_START=558 /DNA_END=794 /DNA_ORIENTATION=-
MEASDGRAGERGIFGEHILEGGGEGGDELIDGGIGECLHLHGERTNKREQEPFSQSPEKLRKKRAGGELRGFERKALVL